MRLRSFGNPDFRQYAPISEPCVVAADTLRDLVLLGEAYIRTWDLGGGNWANPEIKDGGKVIGFMSYNGRVWKGSLKEAKKSVFEGLEEIPLGE